jgi:hypothetical protein
MGCRRGPEREPVAPAIETPLRAAGETRERRAQATHPATVKPELMADGPNQVSFTGHTLIVTTTDAA